MYDFYDTAYNLLKQNLIRKICLNVWHHKYIQNETYQCNYKARCIIFELLFFAIPVYTYTRNDGQQTISNGSPQSLTTILMFVFTLIQNIKLHNIRFWAELRICIGSKTMWILVIIFVIKLGKFALMYNIENGFRLQILSSWSLVRFLVTVKNWKMDNFVFRFWAGQWMYWF